VEKTPRRGARILASAAALTLLPPLAMQAFAAPAPEVKLDQSKKTYIVQMAADPIATYEGDVKGIPATKPAPGEKVNAKAPNAQKYEAHLKNEQRKALRSAKLNEKAKKNEFTVAFNGFTAQLTEAEAAQLKKTSGVINVWEDELRHADTVSTPDYLGLTGKDGVWKTRFGGEDNAGKGIVVGVIDTGIDPDNPSFAALSRSKMPRGNFVCETENDPAFECSSKIVGARWYGEEHGNTVDFDFKSPRDTNGHGSHTAGTAAGNHGVAMTIMGNDMGLGSGMAPAAHVAVYKALWQTEDGQGSGTSAGLVAAIDDAVADGVDVINYSVSGSSTYVVTADELAFMGAAEAGVFVSTSAGNSGDTVGVSSVAHNSPWTMTVAASTHDRGVKNFVTLGNGETYEGVGFGGPLEDTSLVLGSAISTGDSTSEDADLCAPGSLDDAAAAGKVVVCTRGEYALVDKGAEVLNSGGAGMILVNAVGAATSLNAIMYGLPASHLSAEDGVAVKGYAADNPDATAAISASESVTLEAPSMASFSSYGPALAGEGDLLKPDITAPGVDIIAAYSQDPESGAPRFDSLQGTSMSAPHIAGLGALLKQEFPKWSPMAIKSAMMTTASQTTNEGNPIMWGSQAATPLNFGAGEVVPAKSYNPGLVYDSNVIDWYTYACGINQLQLVGGAAVCDQLGAKDPSDLNYPSIAVGKLAASQTVTRTVTNVGQGPMTYTAKVEAPAGTTVKVTPETIQVPANGTATFTLEITRTDAPLGEYTFGALTWVPQVKGNAKGNNKAAKVESVRSPIAVMPVAIAAPGEVIGEGESGSTDISVTAGFSGTLNTDVDGLLASEVVRLKPEAAEGPLDDYVFFAVHEDTKVTRVATYSDEVNAADIDLNVYRLLPGNLIQSVGSSGNADSTEEVTLRNLEAGTYVVAVDNYSGEDDVVAPVHLWTLTDADAGNLTVDPTSADVTSGQQVTFTADWKGLDASQRYLGQVNFLEGDNVAGSTLVTVNP